VVVARAAGRAGRFGAGDAVFEGDAVAWEQGFRVSECVRLVFLLLSFVRYVLRDRGGLCMDLARDSVQAIFLQGRKEERGKKSKQELIKEKHNSNSVDED
jgi:hypothetical protein